MPVKVTIDRVDKTVLQNLIVTMPGLLDDALADVAEQIAGDIVDSFDTSPGGRTYGTHVASLPGYPPNVDSGDLQASIDWERVELMHYVVYDGVPYGIFLELGTENMDPRPFVVPVFELWRRIFPSFIAERMPGGTGLSGDL